MEILTMEKFLQKLNLESEIQGRLTKNEAYWYLYNNCEPLPFCMDLECVEQYSDFEFGTFLIKESLC